MKVLAIIPARGGSKSIPLKNIKLLNGKPLIQYTIESALLSKKLDHIVVSTDHNQIIAICKRFEGIDVVCRPSELATDEAPTESALLHATREIENRYQFVPDIILTLEPTSPLRTPETINKCVEALESLEADSVIGVKETTACYGIVKDGGFKHLLPDQPRRRQDRIPLYKECGAIYGTLYDVLRSKQSVLGDHIYPLVVGEFEALDINTINDFSLVEAVLNLKLN